VKQFTVPKKIYPYRIRRLAVCSATRPRTRRNDGVARQLPARRGAIRDCRPLDAIFALPLPAVSEGAWRATPQAGAGSRRRFPASRQASSLSRSDKLPPGTRLLQVCGAPVLAKFEEHLRSAQTDPRILALYGVALATLDDDPGLRPARTRLSSARRRGSRLSTTFPNTQRVTPVRTHHTIPDRPIPTIA
jgi:hypothetical protein